MSKYIKSDNKSVVITFKWIPFIILTIYVLVTMLICMFGPIKYSDFTVTRKIIVALYILAFLIITWIFMAVSFKNNNVELYEKNGEENKKHIKLFSKLIFIVMTIKIMLFMSSIIYQGIPRTSDIMTTLAQVYTDLHRQETDTNIFRQIDSFTIFLTYIALCGGFFIWQDLKKRTKFFLLITLVLENLYNIFYIGTQKSLFTYVIVFMLIYVIQTIRKKGGLLLKNIILALICVIVLLGAFSSIIQARFTYWNSDMPVYFNSGIHYELNNPLLWIIPEKYKYQITTILSYPTQGYYGLSLCLNTPFEWTFGLGSSRGLNSIISQLFSSIPNMINYTYPLRAESLYGYPGLSNWHTIFPWLASDFTFIGALLYMGIVASVYIRCWIQTIKYENPISFVVLVLLTLQYIFLPANNQLFISRGDSFGVICILVIWLLIGKYMNYNSNNYKSNI